MRQAIARGLDDVDEGESWNDGLGTLQRFPARGTVRGATLAVD